MSNEMAVELVKATPVVGYTGVYLAGVSIADAVSIVMLVYGLCLVIVTAPKAYAQLKLWTAPIIDRVSLWVFKQD